MEQDKFSARGLTSLGPRFQAVRRGVKRIKSIRKFTPSFSNIELAQEINEDQGAIRCAKFSNCGQLLATGGSDCAVRLYCSQKVWHHFAKIRSNAGKVDESVMSSCPVSEFTDNFEYSMLLLFAVFEGHTDDVYGLAWSQCNYLLSISLDKTVRLWHVSQVDTLCIFKHSDYVSTLRFMPLDDRFFVTGCFDGNVRLWSIPQKKVLYCRQVSYDRDNRQTNCTKNIITCSCFLNEGSVLALGTNDGRILLYRTDKLEFVTQCHIIQHGHPKVIGIELVGYNRKQLLITCADSIIRLFNIVFWSLQEEIQFKGSTIVKCPIYASFSPDHEFITCGSEKNCLAPQNSFITLGAIHQTPL